MKNRETIPIIALLFIICFPLTVNANVVWPSLYIAEGLRSWYTITGGLIIEFFFVKFFIKETWVKSFIISAIMNLISTIIGIILIPLIGFLGEILLTPFGGGTFALSHWIFAYILAVLENVIIEGLTVKYIFKYSFKKIFLCILIANSISVILCIVSYGITLDNIAK